MALSTAASGLDQSWVVEASAGTGKCGPYEEERVAGKSQPELEPLKDLRGCR